MSGGGFEPIEEIPESSRTLLVLTVLEDLSDSQLVLSIDERGVEPRHYLALIAILTSATSMISSRYAGESVRARAEVFDQVENLCARLGVENPLNPEDPDVDKTIDEIGRFLDEDTED